jgi:hypothetical protein
VGQAFVSALTGVHVEIPRLQGLADGSFAPGDDGVAINLSLATTGWISQVTGQSEITVEVCASTPFTFSVAAGGVTGAFNKVCPRWTLVINAGGGPCTVEFYDANGIHMVGLDAGPFNPGTNSGNWPPGAKSAKVRCTNATSGSFAP